MGSREAIKAKKKVLYVVVSITDILNNTIKKENIYPDFESAMVGGRVDGFVTIISEVVKRNGYYIKRNDGTKLTLLK